MDRLEFVVGAEHEGERLDRYLASQLPHRSRSQVQRIIEDGHVAMTRVKAAKSNTALREGDTVTVLLPPPAPSSLAAEDLPLPILYQDEDVVVLDKPAGMVVHPGAGHGTGTLVNALLHH